MSDPSGALQPKRPPHVPRVPLQNACHNRSPPPGPFDCHCAASVARSRETLNRCGGEARSDFPPPPLCNSYALVIATVGVGTVLIWYLI